MSRPFLVGERVSYMGLKGFVTDTNFNNNYPIKVESPDDDSFFCFTIDGRYKTNHKLPSLTHLDPPKPKMVKKKGWMPLHNGGRITPIVFHDQKEATLFKVDVIGTAEIEIEVLE